MTDKQTGITVDMHRMTELLREAGSKILLPDFQCQSGAMHTKSDGSVVTETDIKCQYFIREQLSVLYPEIGFLGEEMPEETQRACLLRGNSFWCLDPLDGTSNFIASFPVFGISLALMEDGSPILACIHDPVRGESFSAIRNQGAWLNDVPLYVHSEKTLSESIGFIDFKRLEHTTGNRLATENHYRSQRNLGSCALEWAWLAAGRSHFIIHGNEKLWDYAAGCLIAREAGCTVSDFSQINPFSTTRLSSSIVASTSVSLHQQLVALLR